MMMTAKRTPCNCGRPGCLMPEPVPLQSFDPEKAIVAWLATQNLTLEELRRENRTPGMVEVRRAVARYLHDHYWSSTRIGTFLSRDHSSVLNLLKSEREEAVA
jgi:chromosomal replication initiation ATPase DnaA